MIREKSFYRSFFALALSLALQNLLVYGVNMMDTLMLGRYSQDAMSGVSLCNQVQYLLQMLVVGAGEGAVVLGSQYWGQNRLEPIGHIIGAALRFGGALAVALFALVLVFPEQILALLSNDRAVIAQGMACFRIICFSYVIFTVTNILVASLRSIGVVRIGYVISFSTLCINVCLNYLLIYGHMGCPELGVRGAAIATLVSRTVELAIVAYYLKYREKKLRLTVKKLVRIDKSYLGDYFRVCSPVLINQALWGVAQMVQTGILGHLGGDATAANALAVQLYQVLSVVAYGAASASWWARPSARGSGSDSARLCARCRRCFSPSGWCPEGPYSWPGGPCSPSWAAASPPGRGSWPGSSWSSSPCALWAPPTRWPATTASSGAGETRASAPG